MGSDLLTELANKSVVARLSWKEFMPKGTPLTDGNEPIYFTRLANNDDCCWFSYFAFFLPSPIEYNFHAILVLFFPILTGRDITFWHQSGQLESMTNALVPPQADMLHWSA